MQWSLERIIPKGTLGENHRLRVIKEYIKKIKREPRKQVERG